MNNLNNNVNTSLNDKKINTTLTKKQSISVSKRMTKYSLLIGSILFVLGRLILFFVVDFSGFSDFSDYGFAGIFSLDFILVMLLVLVGFILIAVSLCFFCVAIFSIVKLLINVVINRFFNKR